MGKGATSEAGYISSELLMCAQSFVIASYRYMHRDNRYVYMVHVCFMSVVVSKSCVHPVAVLNDAFSMTCSLLMLVKDARGDNIEE